MLEMVSKLMPRKSLSIEVKKLVLHEAGYKCASPTCRYPITLDIHHLEQISDNGSNEPENLVALCPNCHREHHNGVIPIESLRAWKLLLLSLNEGFDRKTIDLLLALDKAPPNLNLSVDGFLECASLIASGLVDFQIMFFAREHTCVINLSERGKAFVTAWKQGNQKAAIGETINPSAQ